LPTHKNSLFNYLDLHFRTKGAKLEDLDDFLNTMVTLEQTLRLSHDWAVDRIHSLCEQKDYEDAQAIQSEFSEWLNPDIPDHDIFSLSYIGDSDENRSS
jgi:hypothetical protein